MATRKKKATRKKSAKKKTARRKSATGRRPSQIVARIEAELPARLRDYVDEVQTLLDRLEREVQRAGATTGKQLSRLLRETSRQLGKIEERGEAQWRRLSRPYRAEAAKLVGRLRKAIAPPARKKTARKKR